ncbi:MAG TPA: DUF4384 domain-containing protein [Bacteroidota bacterium]|nr:DUF4384 domain-containing protein [Bacteroidota bacterium]
MKLHRAFGILFALLLIPRLAPAQTGGGQQASSDENVAFQWAFGAMVGDEGAKKFVSVTKDTVLHSGDQVKLFVQLTKECYVYVLHVGAKGEVTLLFPYEIKQFATDYKTGKNYYIPKGRSWDALDNATGRETFYVLASADRLLDLEAKIGNYLSADASKKDDMGKDVVAEIRNVKKHYKNFATLAEKPITIGGNVRGLEKAEESRRPDVATIATQISANNFYSKTFTIDHQ